MSIALDDVSFAAGDTLIVDGVSLQAERGKVLGLLGPNGSGKSSLLRLICRLRKIRSGVIRLGDDDLASITRAATATLFFVQSPSFISLQPESTATGTPII